MLSPKSVTSSAKQLPVLYHGFQKACRSAFLDLLQAFTTAKSRFECQVAYGTGSNQAAKNLSGKIFDFRILKDENPFHAEHSKTDFASLPSALVEAGRHD